MATHKLNTPNSFTPVSYLKQIGNLPLIWKGTDLVKAYTGKRALKNSVLSVLTFSQALENSPLKKESLQQALNATNAVLIMDEKIENGEAITPEFVAQIKAEFLENDPVLDQIFDEMVEAMFAEQSYIGKSIDFDTYFNTVVASNAFHLVPAQLALITQSGIDAAELRIFELANQVIRDLTDLLRISENDIEQGSNVVLRFDHEYDVTNPQSLLQLSEDERKQKLLTMKQSYYHHHTEALINAFLTELETLSEPSIAVDFCKSIVEQMFSFVGMQKEILQ